MDSTKAIIGEAEYDDNSSFKKETETSDITVNNNGLKKETETADITVNITRPAYNQAEFDLKYKIQQDDPASTTVDELRKQCSAESIKKRLLGRFPVIHLLRTYRWKNWIVSDIIAGLCVGSIHIPQSMGFALLASLPPVYGLYSSLFPILIYFIFGTSRHISVGTMAVVSIMVGSVINQQVMELNMKPSVTPTPSENAVSQGNGSSSQGTLNSTSTENANDDFVQFKVGIAVSVTFLTGSVQILMSILKLDIVATFMSKPFNNGFMAGVVCHILTSQVPFCLGFKIPPQLGIGTLPRSWFQIFKSISQTNWQTLIICLISMLFLIVCKEIINEKFKKLLKLPFPSELLLIITGTLISYLVDFNGRYNVAIIENIPLGFPPPKLPTFHNAYSYIIDSFIIATVGYFVCMSMARIYSEKYNYEINPNQELFAFGMMHMVTSFFNGFAGSQAPPRTVVNDSSGGKTQVASLVAALLVLLVILALGPLFEALPNCVLSAVIIVSTAPLLKLLRDLPQYWRANKNDFVVCTLTFLIVVVVSIDRGLWLGLIISLLTIALEHHRTSGELLVKAGDTEIYTSKSTCNQDTSTAQKNLFLFKFESPIYFVNVDKFKKELFTKTINPDRLKADDDLQKGTTNRKSEDSKVNVKDANTHTEVSVANNNAEELTTSNHSLLLSHKQYDHLYDYKRPEASRLTVEMQDLSTGKTPRETNDRNGIIILDCSAVSYIDMMGVNCLKLMISTYKEVNVDLVFAKCPGTLINKMRCQGIDVNASVYPTVEDAVLLV